MQFHRMNLFTHKKGALNAEQICRSVAVSQHYLDAYLKHKLLLALFRDTGVMKTVGRNNSHVQALLLLASTTRFTTFLYTH